MGTKNELQRRLRLELRNQDIDTDFYEFEDEEERYKFTAGCYDGENASTKSESFV